MNSLYPLTRSQQTTDGYCIGKHELTTLDTLEFLDGEYLVRGAVVHDGMRYMVVTTTRRILPLAEIVIARFIGHTPAAMPSQLRELAHAFETKDGTSQLWQHEPVCRPIGIMAVLATFNMQLRRVRTYLCRLNAFLDMRFRVDIHAPVIHIRRDRASTPTAPKGR